MVTKRVKKVVLFHPWGGLFRQKKLFCAVRVCRRELICIRNSVVPNRLRCIPRQKSHQTPKYHPNQRTRKIGSPPAARIAPRPWTDLVIYKNLFSLIRCSGPPRRTTIGGARVTTRPPPRKSQKSKGNKNKKSCKKNYKTDLYFFCFDI